MNYNPSPTFIFNITSIFQLPPCFLFLFKQSVLITSELVMLYPQMEYGIFFFKKKEMKPVNVGARFPGSTLF